MEDSKDTIVWLGHAGFRLSIIQLLSLLILSLAIHDKKGVAHTLYIDPWFDNPKIPESEKTPRKADLVLVTHGHFDHVLGTPTLLAANKEAKAVCIFEVGEWLKSKGAAEDQVVQVNKGGTLDFEWVKVVMVSADHSGGCPGENCIIPGGAAAGFVIQFNNRVIYHAGDTNVFGDMKTICDLYYPDTAFLPIGGHFTMAPYEVFVFVKGFLKVFRLLMH